jgi:hypothetical protein
MAAFRATSGPLSTPRTLVEMHIQRLIDLPNAGDRHGY